MFWIIPAVLSAIFDSLKDVSSKKSLKNVDPEVAALANAVFAIPVMALAVIAFEKPVFDSGVLGVLIINSAVLSVALLLYAKSLKTTDISLAIPFTALTPVFMLVVAPIILGEFTTTAGSAGVLLIAVGAYLINAKKASRGVLEPLKAIVRDRGVLLMLIVGFLWSITATIDKIGLLHSTPFFYITAFFALTSLFLGIGILLKSKKQGYLLQIKNNFVPLLCIGVFFGLSEITYIYALKFTLAAYAVAIKRNNALFSVLLGAIIFKEKNIRERLLGAALMVAGVVIISVL